MDMFVSSFLLWFCYLGIGLLTACLIWYRYMTFKYRFFQNRGIPGPQPSFPFGTLNLMKRHGGFNHDLKLREEYGDIVGTFQGRTPAIVLFDTDILTQIAIKQFNSFHDRSNANLGHAFYEDMIPNMKGNSWKSARSMLAKALSSCKLRLMSNVINRTATSMVEGLRKYAESGESFQCQERCGAFGLDTAFGVGFNMDLDSQANLNNPYLRSVKDLVAFSENRFRILLSLLAPFSLKMLGKIGLLSALNARKCLVSVMQKGKTSPKSNTEGKDILQSMFDTQCREREAVANKERTGGHNATMLNQIHPLTDRQVMAQGLVLQIAGFNTIRRLLSGLLYAIATNPDVQKRLVAEIDNIMDGQDVPTYDLVAQMQYLQQCIDEAARMYPTIPRLNRQCTKDITINGIFFPKGIIVIIPTFAIHNDPRYFPNPSKFDPERFSPEEKAKRHDLAWWGFGVGPRICPAKRLGLFMMKVCVVHLLRAYTVLPSSESPAGQTVQQLWTPSGVGPSVRLTTRK